MEIAKSTKKMYEFYLKRYEKSDFSKPREMLEALLEAKNKKGVKLSVPCIKLIICAIIWKLKNEKGDKEVISKYQSYVSALRAKSNEKESDNSQYAGIIPKWDEIVKIREEQKDKKKWKNYLILSLYTYLPPRRFNDYLYMKIALTPNNMKDHNFNYYDMKDKVFVFNFYKTSKTYKQQSVEIPEKLQNIIDEYIEQSNLKSGDSLLGFTSYQQILRILKKLLNCGIDNIRHSYINHEYEAYTKNGLPNNKILEENALIMGHSLQTHLRYRKDVNEEKKE
jgi:hypothetical protein